MTRKSKRKKTAETEDSKISRKAGLAPGTLVHIGDLKTAPVMVSRIIYSEEGFEEKVFKSSDNFLEPGNPSKITWLNVDGIHHVELIDAIGKHYGLHPLLLEDILNTQNRPKADFYDNYLLFTLNMLGINEAKDSIISEQVSFVLGKDFLLSFEEDPGDLFDPVRERIRTGKGKIRKKKADYLLYSLIDAVVDNYYIIIENFSEIVENLEDQVLENPDDNILREVQHVKRQLVQLRRSVFPLREAVATIYKDETLLIDPDNSKYLRDVYDHTLHIFESIEALRDVVSGIKDLYISELSNRMNKIMKVLTIISTIFIPLTFIAGIYGMNFDVMPELHWQWGYFGVWIFIAILTIFMLFYFKSKKWL